MWNDAPPPTHGIARRGVCLVVSAPAGAGKSTILRNLRVKEPDLRVSVSATTRAPRPGERDGFDYHFTDRQGFDHLIETNAMLEHATVFGRSYGTPRAPVETSLAEGLDIGFDIDWQGHRQLRAALPDDVVSVFILPPSIDALRTRLITRAGDPQDEIDRRMAAAQAEISHWSEFDHVVINDDLAHATTAVRAILHAARTARPRQPGLPGFIAALTGT